MHREASEIGSVTKKNKLSNIFVLNRKILYVV